MIIIVETQTAGEQKNMCVINKHPFEPNEIPQFGYKVLFIDNKGSLHSPIYNKQLYPRKRWIKDNYDHGFTCYFTLEDATPFFNDQKVIQYSTVQSCIIAKVKVRNVILKGTNCYSGLVDVPCFTTKEMKIEEIVEQYPKQEVPQ